MRKPEDDIDYVGRDRRSMPLPFQSLNLLAFSFFFFAPLDFLSFLPLSSSGLSPPLSNIHVRLIFANLFTPEV